MLRVGPHSAGCPVESVSLRFEIDQLDVKEERVFSQGVEIEDCSVLAEFFHPDYNGLTFCVNVEGIADRHTA